MTNETNPGTVEATQADRSLAHDLHTSALATWPEQIARHRLAAQSQPAATGQELEDKISEMIESALVRHGVDLADVEGTRDDAQAILAALTAEPAAKAGDAEPVAVIGKDWQLLWASADTLKTIVDRTGVKIGSPLYAAPPSPQPDMGSVENALAELDGSDFEAVRRHSRTLRAALSPPASQSVEKIAYAIIKGSAGERAADHAREFVTANWEDAMRSARAVVALSTLPHKEEATPAPAGEQGAVAGRNVEYFRTCQRCNGYGGIGHADASKCPDCHGNGVVKIAAPAPQDEGLREAAKAGRNILWHIHRRGRVSYDAYEHGNFADLTVALDRLDAVLGFATPATTTERGRG